MKNFHNELTRIESNINYCKEQIIVLSNTNNGIQDSAELLQYYSGKITELENQKTKIISRIEVKGAKTIAPRYGRKQSQNKKNYR